MPTRDTTARARSGRCVRNAPISRAAVAAAHHRQFIRAGVFALDEMFGAGDKVVEDMLLARQVAGAMPFLAEFAAAAQIGHRITPPASNQIAPRGN